jgi:hypothetical protein
MMWRPRADHGQKHEAGDETSLGDLTPDGPLQKHYFAIGLSEAFVL